MKKELAIAARQKIDEIEYLEQILKTFSKEKPKKIIIKPTFGSGTSDKYVELKYGISTDIIKLFEGKLKNAYQELEELENNY
jgi:hypothetical protein